MANCTPGESSPAGAWPAARYWNCCGGGSAPSGDSENNPAPLAYRLCGDLRSLARYVPAWLENSLASTRTTKKSEPLIAAVTPPLPPLHTKIGLFNEPSSITSWVRPDRTGPTGSGVFDWN